jgi:26S proteasome regulatory subunit N7
MADDSVPQPFPNIKVPQWHYQIEHVERLKGEAGEKFWKAVEEDGKCYYKQLTLMDIDRLA